MLPRPGVGVGARGSDSAGELPWWSLGGGVDASFGRGRSAELERTR